MHNSLVNLLDNSFFLLRYEYKVWRLYTVIIDYRILQTVMEWHLWSSLIL